MNTHNTYTKHSMIFESFAVIHCYLSEISKKDILPESLYSQIKSNSAVQYLKTEPSLQFSIFEMFIDNHERHEFQTFKKNYQKCTILDLQYYLLSGLYSRETITEKNKNLKQHIQRMSLNNIKLFQTYFENPKTLFDEIVILAESIFYHADFRNLFNLNILTDIKKRYADTINVLENRHPLSYSQSLMGKSFYNIADWSEYEFLYSYMLYPYKLRLMDQTRNIMLLSLYDRDKTDEEQLNEIKNGIKLISDPTRLSILRMIYANPMFGKEIAETLSLTTATVSHHLDVLRKEGLIHIERDKNTKYYSTNQRQFDKLISLLSKYIKKN
ncbi:MAG: winged helix-turn-helix transcriptional regulator [Clostridiales bacterium]|nr:winged helix-turn-helix transcriptional regulator [Clostridiales bacterium]